MIFLFPTNMILHFCKKAKMIFPLKYDNAGVIEKDDTDTRK